MNLDIPSDLQPTLEALQKHYQEIIDYAHAQLTHAEALLGKPVFSLTPLLPIEQPQTVSPVIPVDSTPIPAATPKPAPKASKPQATISKSSPTKAKPSSKAKAAPLKPKDLLELKPQYQGKALLVIIGEVLKGREGEAVLTSDIVNELHGKLSPELFKTAKERLGKSLSKGKIDGLWDGVPGRTGYYTISLKTLKS